MSSISERLKTAAKTAKAQYHTKMESEEGLSSFELSKYVNLIEVGLWYSGRVSLHTKIAVLRALADRYPNVWPGVPDIAKKAHSSPTQVRLALRELEFEDELISEIVRPGHGSKGGGFQNTVQYRINVDAIARLLELQPLIRMIVANPTGNPTANATGNATGAKFNPTGTEPNPTGPVALPNGYTLPTPTATRWGTDNERPTNENIEERSAQPNKLSGSEEEFYFDPNYTCPDCGVHYVGHLCEAREFERAGRADLFEKKGGDPDSTTTFPPA
jgi:hypothetical protein